MSTPTPLGEIIDQINSIIAEASENKNYLEALKKLHTIVKQNEDLLKTAPETYEAVKEAEYAMAYNALVDGADPSEVRNNVLDEVWKRLESEGVIEGTAIMALANALADNNWDKAQHIYNIYRPFLSDEAATIVSVLASPEARELVSAVSGGDLDALYETIRKLEETGRYNQFKEVLRQTLQLDLDSLRRDAYTYYVYKILEEADDVEEAYRKLQAAREVAEEAGLEELVRDIEYSVSAINSAKRGDVDAFIDNASQIQDVNLLRYTLARGIPHIHKEYPDKLASLPENKKRRLEELLGKAGFNVDLDSLGKLREAYYAAVNLRSLVIEGTPEEALQYWQSLSPDIKEIVAALVGSSVGEIEEALQSRVYVSKLAEEANKLVDLLYNGKYEEAYRFWTSLPEDERKSIAVLLDEDPGELDKAIRLAAGMQALLRLENPTIDQVKRTLAEYVGPTLADRIARELLKDSPLYKVTRLVEAGKYEEALGMALREVPEEEKEIAIHYILTSINEKEGPEALAKFIDEHEGQLKPYIPDTLFKSAQIILTAGALAETLIQTIEEAAVKEYGERIKKLLDDFEESLSRRDWGKAESLLERNRELLTKAQIDGASLYDFLKEVLVFTKLADDLDKKTEQLETLAGSNDPTQILSMAGKIAEQAKAAINRIRGLRHIDAETKNEYIQAYKRLAAYAHALQAQAFLQKGFIGSALVAAEKAKNMDRNLTDLYNTVKVLVEAVRDRENLEQNIRCILLNVMGIEPAKGGGPSRTPKQIRYT